MSRARLPHRARARERLSVTDPKSERAWRQHEPMLTETPTALASQRGRPESGLPENSMPSLLAWAGNTGQALALFETEERPARPPVEGGGRRWLKASSNVSLR